MIDSSMVKWLCLGFLALGLARILAAQNGVVIP